MSFSQLKWPSFCSFCLLDLYLSFPYLFIYFLLFSLRWGWGSTGYNYSWSGIKNCEQSHHGWIGEIIQRIWFGKKITSLWWQKESVYSWWASFCMERVYHQACGWRRWSQWSQVRIYSRNSVFVFSLLPLEFEKLRILCVVNFLCCSLW